MAIKTAGQLKAFLESGDAPTQTQWGHLIDTLFSIKDIAEQAASSTGLGAATDATAGIVKVNTVAADPVVYRKQEVDTLLGGYQVTSAKGVANGYASLDADGLVPAAQIPPSSGFGTQAQNKVLASPDGSTGSPNFRSLAGADLPELTLDDTVVPADDTGPVPTLLNELANRIKAVTGASDWFDDPDASIADIIGMLGSVDGIATLDSGGKIPETQLPDSILGQVDYQEPWNATTNTPAIPAAASGNKGHYYITSSAVAAGHGYANIPDIDFQVGDWIISDGTAWSKIDNTDAVTTVHGRIGAVVAANGDYTTTHITNSSTVTGSTLTDALETIASHLSATEAHGASGAVVGTTGAQKLTDKNIVTTTNAQVGTSYILVLSDAGKLVTLNNGSAITLEVPPNSSVAFDIGTTVNLAQLGAGQVTIDPGIGVTVESRGAADKIAGQSGMATLHKIASDTWLLFGDIIN